MYMRIRHPLSHPPPSFPLPTTTIEPSSAIVMRSPNEIHDTRDEKMKRKMVLLGLGSRLLLL